MNPAGSGQPMGGYPGLNYAAAMMGLANPYAAVAASSTREAQLAAALSLQGRNPYTTGAASGNAYPPSVSASVASNMYGAPNHYQLSAPMQAHHIGRSNQGELCQISKNVPDSFAELFFILGWHCSTPYLHVLSEYYEAKAT